MVENKVNWNTILVILVVGVIGILLLNNGNLFSGKVTGVTSRIGNLEKNDKQVILNILNTCYVNSQLTSRADSSSLSGNSFCGNSGKCVAAYFSEVPNPQDPNYILQNTIRTSCAGTYEGNTASFYIQSVCCVA